MTKRNPPSSSRPPQSTGGSTQVAKPRQKTSSTRRVKADAPPPSVVLSFSDFKTHSVCQRRWCFKEQAQWNAKDPSRREMHILKSLQSVQGWRGQLVDTVLSKFVLTQLNYRRFVALEQAIEEAKRLWKLQLEFGREHRVREAGMTKTGAGDTFAAFYDVEYGGEVSDDAFDEAWEEIESSLRNFYDMRSLVHTLRNASYLAIQSRLQFDFYGTKVQAVPDVIIFRGTQSPVIVDWKVHAFAGADYRSQLALYALALTRCRPHAGFPASLANFQPQDISLVEVQLLKGVERKYTLEQEDVDDLEDYLAAHIEQIKLSMRGQGIKDMTPKDFPATSFDSACGRCNFRRLCWDETQ